jgi:hypothetical protein
MAKHLHKTKQSIKIEEDHFMDKIDNWSKRRTIEAIEIVKNANGLNIDNGLF